MTQATQFRRPAAPPPTNGGAAKPAGAIKFRRIQSGTIQGVRLILNAVEGWGKTTLGAHAPDPAIIMVRGETGFETLRQAGRVPDCMAGNADDWESLLATIAALRDEKSVKTVVLDALGGAERLCHEYVCAKEFSNDWGERGFMGYQRGYEVALTEWSRLLGLLDTLRAAGKHVVILSHATIRNVKNPMGADYDKFVADVHPKTTWGLTAKWADAVLFGTFATVVKTSEKDAKKGKGIGGTERVLYTEGCDAFTAKNRYGMSNPISLLDVGPDGMWDVVWNEIVNGGASSAPAANEDMPPA